GLDLLDPGLVLAEQVHLERAALLEDGLGVVVVPPDLHNDAAVASGLVGVFAVAAGNRLRGFLRLALSARGPGLGGGTAPDVEGDGSGGKAEHRENAKLAQHGKLLCGRMARSGPCPGARS